MACCSGRPHRRASDGARRQPVRPALSAAGAVALAAARDHLPAAAAAVAPTDAQQDIPVDLPCEQPPPIGRRRRRDPRAEEQEEQHQWEEIAGWRE